MEPFVRVLNTETEYSLNEIRSEYLREQFVFVWPKDWELAFIRCARCIGRQLKVRCPAYAAAFVPYARDSFANHTLYPTLGNL